MVRHREPGPGAILLADTASGTAAPVAAARARVDQIREAIQELSTAGARLCLALADAHDARDWDVLGYSSFAAYLAAELGISRAHGYRLVDHARVIRALAEAAKLTPEQVVLPERTSRRIATRLEEVAAEVRHRTEGVPGSERSAILAEVIAEAGVSPAGDSVARCPMEQRAARALVRLANDGDGAVPERLASAIAEILGAELAALERCADYLADASALLRRRGGNQSNLRGRRQPRRQRAFPASAGAGGVPAGQLTLWQHELPDAEERS